MKKIFLATAFFIALTSPISQVSGDIVLPDDEYRLDRLDHSILCYWPGTGCKSNGDVIFLPMP